MDVELQDWICFQKRKFDAGAEISITIVHLIDMLSINVFATCP